MRKRKILASALAVCLFVFLTSTLEVAPNSLTKEQKATIQRELSPLSKKEGEKLKELFDHFYFFDGFAYTLFGKKPMSFGRLLPTPEATKGWKAWEKISFSFDSEKFIVRKHVYNGYDFVLVANLEEIEKVYHQNQAQFDRAFNSHMTLEALISCLREDTPLSQELMHNHLLVGILLGYGTHNAELFTQNQTLEREKRTPLQFFSGKIHPIFYILSPMMPVSFACDPSTEETKELKKRYTQERKTIMRLAKKDPLFLLMLAKLKDPTEEKNHR